MPDDLEAALAARIARVVEAKEDSPSERVFGWWTPHGMKIHQNDFCFKRGFVVDSNMHTAQDERKMPTRTTKKTQVVTRLPAHVVREIAVAANTDPRTVARVVAGKPTRESTRARIEEALAARG